MCSADHPQGDQHLSEAQIIARVARRFADADPRVEVGIGDDAAVLGPATGDADARQLVTTDLLVEGVHFQRGWLSLEDIGYKSLAVNLSDIAAMGGRATLAFGTLGVPRAATAADIDALLAGIEQAAREAGVILAGGDTVAAPQWVIGFTVLGECPGPPLLRGGVQPGDVIWHSGQLGLSQAGLSLLAAGLSPAGEEETVAIAAHRRPRARLQLGEWLQRSGLVTACLDLSDSLAQCLLQLADASDIGLKLDFRGYPFAAAVQGFVERRARRSEDGSGGFELAGRCDPGGQARRCRSLAEFVLGSAEDYELLLAAPATATRTLLDGCPLPLTRLGTAAKAGRERFYIDEGGDQHELRPLGYTHLSSDAD